MEICTVNLDNATRMKLIRLLGETRQKSFYEFFKSRFSEDKGFKVVSYDRNSVFPDIVIYKDGVPYMAIEIKNYNVNGYMTKKCLDRIVSKFTTVPKETYKLLIISSRNNLTIKRKTSKIHTNTQYTYTNILYNFVDTEKLLKRHGIEVMVMDRQDFRLGRKRNYNYEVIEGE